MIAQFIKYLFIIISAIYTFTKILKFKKKQNITYNLFLLLFLFSSALICCIAKNYFSIILIPALILLTFLFMSVFYFCPYKISLQAIIISYGLSLSIFAISTCIMCVILNLCNYQVSKHLIISQLIISITQFLLIYILFKIERLKNGMPFLIHSKYNDLGIFLSIAIIICITILYNNNSNLIYSIPIIFTILGFLILFLWWKGRLRSLYITKVQSRKIETLTNEINLLKKDNDILSKLIHKDNKIVTAMLLSVNTYLNSDNPDRCLGEQLLDELHTLSSEREEIILSSSPTDLNITATHHISVDSLINYMYQKALQEKIKLSFSSNIDFNNLFTIISENDFSTILADLIENAIISTSHNSGKYILITIYYMDGNFTVDIFDCGDKFDKKVLVNLGLRRITTHKGTGSGIGLSSTYELCYKYKASILIDETISTLYNKKISIIFDNKNDYKLITNCTIEDELYLSRRSDLIIKNSQNNL